MEWIHEYLSSYVVRTPQDEIEYQQIVNVPKHILDSDTEDTRDSTVAMSHYEESKPHVWINGSSDEVFFDIFAAMTDNYLSEKDDVQ